jgi:L-fuconolactonase
VLDHIGKPAIKVGLMDPWRKDMKELAALPNVECKISGVATEADHTNWTREQIRPYIAHAIETFGFDRVMYGGDWHVMELASTYPEWVDIVDWVTVGASADEKRKLFRDNAIRFYRL